MGDLSSPLLLLSRLRESIAGAISSDCLLVGAKLGLIARQPAEHAAVMSWSSRYPSSDQWGGGNRGAERGGGGRGGAGEEEAGDAIWRQTAQRDRPSGSGVSPLGGGIYLRRRGDVRQGRDDGSGDVRMVSGGSTGNGRWAGQDPGPGARTAGSTAARRRTGPMLGRGVSSAMSITGDQ